MKKTRTMVRGSLLIISILGLLGCPNLMNDDTDVNDSQDDTHEAPSNNAELSGIDLSAGTLEPSFDPAVTSYTVAVDGRVAEITVTGTAEDADASVGGDSGSPQPLNIGSNTIIVTVTAQDGTSVQEYTVAVDRDEDSISAALGTLKYVPAGSFQRDGTDTNISIISAPYRMSRYEITRQQFEAVMGTDPSDPAYSTGPTDPVQMVNWYHAIAFCNKLSLEEGLEPAYSVTGISDWANLAFDDVPATTSDSDWDAAVCDWEADGYRLPTEMEWMWAAMGADQDSQTGAMQEDVNVTGYAKDYAGDDGTNSIDDYAWYNDTSPDAPDSTHPAGEKSPNELGMYDMSGNAAEWCWDWYGNYPTGELTDYHGAGPGTDRVNRGGGFRSLVSDCSVSSRYNPYPYDEYRDYGFRVVRPVCFSENL